MAPSDNTSERYGHKVATMFAAVYGLEYFIFPTLVDRANTCPPTSSLGCATLRGPYVAAQWRCTRTASSTPARASGVPQHAPQRLAPCRPRTSSMTARGMRSDRRSSGQRPCSPAALLPGRPSCTQRTRRVFPVSPFSARSRPGGPAFVGAATSTCGKQHAPCRWRGQLRQEDSGTLRSQLCHRPRS